MVSKDLSDRIQDVWHVYILESSNGKLYTGITNNVERRMKVHKEGRGARFTRIFGFNKLLYSSPIGGRADALKREAKIKRWPREKKLMLIEGKEFE